jgi:hypothetical protein
MTQAATANIPADATVVLPPISGDQFRALLFGLDAAQSLCAVNPRGPWSGPLYYTLADIVRMLERDWRYLDDMPAVS